MNSRTVFMLPAATFLGAALALALWWRSDSADAAKLRLPGADAPPGTNAAAVLNPVAAGSLANGAGSPGPDKGAWPQFRGPNRDDLATEPRALARAWEARGPREIWGVDCGEGYAGVAVRAGRVYMMDYDADKKQNALRCLSAEDGRECWRYAYPLALKRNHGMTRTVPAVTETLVVAIDSKCNVLCLEAKTGALRWGINLVHDYGATVPPWYTGQCPLVDSNAVILAPGGREALLLAVDLETGKPLWRTPNPRGWKMTHSSIMPMEFAGQRSYLYCGSGGVVSVAATNGAILWDMTDWKISIATVPSPLVLEDGKIFLSGGYNAGSMMLQLQNADGRIVPRVLFKLGPEVFGATQHTPVFHAGHIYGIRPNGQFVCLDLAGKVVWTSPPGKDFGLGPFMLADGLFFVMNDSGTLTLLDASAGSCSQLAEAKVLTGRESWGPMALANGRLFVRSLTRLACLDVAANQIAAGQ
jgi:outer membrane protein assembly factor BamB